MTTVSCLFNATGLIASIGRVSRSALLIDKIDPYINVVISNILESLVIFMTLFNEWISIDRLNQSILLLIQCVPNQLIYLLQIDRLTLAVNINFNKEIHFHEANIFCVISVASISRQSVVNIVKNLELRGLGKTLLDVLSLHMVEALTSAKNVKVLELLDSYSFTITKMHLLPSLSPHYLNTRAKKIAYFPD